MDMSRREEIRLRGAAIGVGAFFFIYFALLCFYRELGPDNPSGAPFVLGVLLGGAAVIAGAHFSAFEASHGKSGGGSRLSFADGLSRLLFDLARLPRFLLRGEGGFGLHRGVGLAFAIEGVAMVALTALAWFAMGRVALPPVR